MRCLHVGRNRLLASLSTTLTEFCIAIALHGRRRTPHHLWEVRAMTFDVFRTLFGKVGASCAYRRRHWTLRLERSSLAAICGAFRVRRHVGFKGLLIKFH